METNTFNIRVMTRREVDIALEWAALEGWNPGLYDADCFYAADPNGFLIGLIDDVPAASISVVKYGGTFGFLGFYIVRPKYRGMGYGLKIWNAGLSYLQDCTVGLDGVADQQENYRKSGFSLAYSNIRYQKIADCKYKTDKRIVPLSDIPFEKLNAYDQPFFPADRRTFLKCWIAQPKSTALGIVVNGKICGYGMIRKCRTGYKVGPLFADSKELADILFQAFISNVPGGSPVYLDIPAVNPEAIALVEEYKMNIVFKTARMYKGEFPDLPISRLFGVTSFELG